MKRLDGFERQVEEELEKAEKKLEEGAKAVTKKRPVSIRLSERDIALLKKKSLETGIPYQTLIATLVRQYVEGKIRIEL